MITGDPGLSLLRRSFVQPRSGQLSVLVASLYSWPALSPWVGSPLRRRHLLQDLFEKQETFFLTESCWSFLRHYILPSFIAFFLPCHGDCGSGPASIETMFLWQSERGGKEHLRVRRDSCFGKPDPPPEEFGAIECPSLVVTPSLQPG